MLRRAFVVLALILFSVIIAGPTSGSNLTVKRPIKISDQQIPAILSNQKTLKSGNRLMQSPGTIIDSTYWDWQRNGGMDDHVIIFDDYGYIKINATMMTAYLEDTSDLQMRHYHWNGGVWAGHGLTVFPVRNGFGSMSQFPEGNPVFCTQGNVDLQGMRAWGAFEAFIGKRVYSFQGTSTDTVQLWPRITVNSDDSWIITGSGLTVYGIENSASWARSPNRVSPFSSWRFFNDIAPDWIDDDMEWPTIQSGTNGRVGVVIPDYGGSVRLFESTDNGETFYVITIAPADTANLPASLDSTAARLGWINSDIMYIGDDPHVVWSAGQGVMVGGEYELLDFKSTIFHWSPTTGIDTVVVASTQSADPSRDDYVPVPANHLSVDWPSIGLAVDGKTLVVAYTAFNPDDIDSTAIPPPLGYVDIWMTTSSDNGESWTEPQNATNPDGIILGWDDRYPSISKVNLDNEADPGKDVYMIYQSDDLAGTFVQGTEGSLNMDYIKFVGIDLAAVGIGDGGDEGFGANIPKVFSLSQNYPNPFNPSTTIDYSIPTGEKVQVQLLIYDLRGRLIRALINEEKSPGSYSVHWDGRSNEGREVGSGVYLYRIESDSFTSTRKMTILR